MVYLESRIWSRYASFRFLNQIVLHLIEITATHFKIACQHKHIYIKNIHTWEDCLCIEMMPWANLKNIYVSQSTKNKTNIFISNPV